MRGGVSKRAGDPGRRRRALTVLELVVVVAILAALAGLVLPAVWNWSGASEFDEVMRQVELAVAEARADAERDGRPAQLVILEKPDGAVLGLEYEDAAASADTPTALREFFTFPRSFSVRTGTESASDAPGAAVPPQGDSAIEPVTVPKRMLAGYWPDGTVRVGEAVVLARGERRARVTIDGWTGGALVAILKKEAAPEDGAAKAPSTGAEGGEPTKGGES